MQPISGEGEYEWGGLHVITEILVKLTDIGNAHEHGGGNQPRIQHAGLIGIYYINDDDDLHDVVWWAFLDFANMDIVLPPLPFGVHGMFWNLEQGVEGNMGAGWA